MVRQWKYIANQFETETRLNYRKALKLSNHHDAALLYAVSQDPTFQPLYDRYHPLHQSLDSRYSIWKSADGAQQSATENMKQKLNEAMGKLDGWDVAIQVLYPTTTPRYVAIFPDGRKPFHDGGLVPRISAFATLGLNIGADPALVMVKMQVDATHLLLDGVRDAQTVAKGSLKAASGQVNLDRIDAMNMQYRNMCFVLDNFFNQRDIIIPVLHDLELLRDLRQTLFTGTLAASETKHIVKRLLMADDMLRLKCIGNATISFYLATTEGGTDSTAVVVNANLQQEIAAADFGITDYNAHRYLTVVNQSAGETVQYEAELE